MVAPSECFTAKSKKPLIFNRARGRFSYTELFIIPHNPHSPSCILTCVPFHLFYIFRSIVKSVKRSFVEYFAFTHHRYDIFSRLKIREIDFIETPAEYENSILFFFLLCIYVYTDTRVCIHIYMKTSSIFLPLLRRICGELSWCLI